MGDLEVLDMSCNTRTIQQNRKDGEEIWPWRSDIRTPGGVDESRSAVQRCIAAIGGLVGGQAVMTSFSKL